MSRSARFVCLIAASIPVVGLGLACIQTVSLVLAGTAIAQQRVAPPSREAVQYSFAPIVRKAAPAVVNVYVRSRVQAFTSPFADDPWFRRFFGDQFGEPSEQIGRAHV